MIKMNWKESVKTMSTPPRKPLPYFASNGAVICEQKHQDIFEVGFIGSPNRGSSYIAECEVDTDCVDEYGEWVVNFLPHVSISDEKQTELANQARIALDEWMCPSDPSDEKEGRQNIRGDSLLATDWLQGAREFAIWFAARASVWHELSIVAGSFQTKAQQSKHKATSVWRELSIAAGALQAKARQSKHEAIFQAKTLLNKEIGVNLTQFTADNPSLELDNLDLEPDRP